MYCSEGCRSEAYFTYHRTECKMIKFYERESSVDWREPLALRSFLKAIRQGKELSTILEKFTPPNTSRTNADTQNLLFVHSFLSALHGTRIKGKSLIPLVKKALGPAVEMIMLLRYFWSFQSKPHSSVSFEEFMYKTISSSEK